MDVSLVIPGRNAEATLAPCLASVVPLLESGQLREILFVDDGSTDGSAEIASSYPVRLIRGPGGGPGAARNRGWRASESALIWFIDADCVAEPEALAILRQSIDQPGVGGAGGSYSNLIPAAAPGGWIARAIHAEIVSRHGAMSDRVDFLGSFNVLYCRAALEEVGGFDEHRFNGPGSPGAEDAELAYRLHSGGYELAFDARSRVGHHHPTSLSRYLRSQRQHGFWRVQLYARHPKRSGGDAYSGMLDHLQPPLALLALASLPTLVWPALRWIAPLLFALLLLAQLPMTVRLVRREGIALWSFAPLSFARAFCRGFGLLAGVIALPWRSGATPMTGAADESS